MKVLLDECLPLDLRHSFPGKNVHTVQWAGFKSKKNGELLRAAELAGYNVLLTVDQGIPHQQNLVGRTISVITIRAKTNQLEDLLPFVTAVLDACQRIKSGQVMTLDQ